MPKVIYEFRLSDHFMKQGWDRSIDESTLKCLLRFIHSVKSGKKIAIVTPGFYKAQNIQGKENQCLVLIIKGKVLVTGYWCKDPNYLHEKEKEAKFQWLYL